MLLLSLYTCSLLPHNKPRTQPARWRTEPLLRPSAVMLLIQVKCVQIQQPWHPQSLWFISHFGHCGTSPRTEFSLKASPSQNGSFFFKGFEMMFWNCHGATRVYQASSGCWCERTIPCNWMDTSFNKKGLRAMMRDWKRKLTFFF